MNTRSARGLRLRHLAAGLVLAGLTVVGCGQKPQPETPSTSAGAPAASAQPASGGKTVAKASAPAPIQRDRLHQAFADAVRTADNPPADGARPPDETMTRKRAHRILAEVQKRWDAIRFTGPDGKKLACTARVETNQGVLDIALFPEQAPNHVRSFIALAQAGYYDGLLFERILHEPKNEMNQELHMIEAGCPLGTGETGTGSIGYWLKKEFTPPDRMSHDEGVVGACRGEEEDSAATRFYITLNKAPYLDGNYTIFGKVVQGMDVLRTIAQQPVIVDEEGNRRPEKPIVIHKVTIVTRELEAASK